MQLFANPGAHPARRWINTAASAFVGGVETPVMLPREAGADLQPGGGRY